MWYYFIDTDESDDMEEIIVLNKEGKQVDKHLSKFCYVISIYFFYIIIWIKTFFYLIYLIKSFCDVCW